MKRRLCAALCSASCVLGLSTPAHADDREHYFYHGYDYGSQALFDPISVFLNRGYDVLQVRVRTRNIFDQGYSVNSPNVARNLANPFPNIASYGWWKFTSEELLPLTFHGNETRWVPNYSLHLIGGGMTYSALREWFRDNGVPAPWLFSSVTLLSAAFINESLENKGVVGRNTDAIADFYFFDIGGIILFSFDWVNRFFSQQIVLMDWSLQPGFIYPGFDLHNQGNFFAAKWALPFYPKLRAFAYFGLSSLWGLSYKVDGEYSISAAGGVKSSRLVNESASSVLNRVEFVPSGGLFVDRNNSLLASLEVSNVQDYFIQFNMYPNALADMARGLGLWTVIDKSGHFILGASFSHALGFGAGIGSL